MSYEFGLKDWFGPGNEERRSLTYPAEQGLGLAVLNPLIDAEGALGTSVRSNAPSDQEEQDSNAQGKAKKQKEASISLEVQLLRDKVITAEQLEQSLTQQARTGESLVRILVRNRYLRMPQLAPYVKIGDLRKFAILDLENDYYQGTLRIMLIHRRNFRLFLGVCALTMLAAVWFHDQIQGLGYLFALAALATVYHRIQRRYYDLQAFFKQSRTTVLNALESCTTVGELSMVRDYARAGFATAIPMGYQDSSTGLSSNKLTLDFLGIAAVVAFVVLLLLGIMKAPAGLQLPVLSQETMSTR
jgi:hypothetical protein